MDHFNEFAFVCACFGIFLSDLSTLGAMTSVTVVDWFNGYWAFYESLD